MTPTALCPINDDGKSIPTGTSGGGWRSLKTVVAEHNDCHGEDEEVAGNTN